MPVHASASAALSPSLNALQTYITACSFRMLKQLLDVPDTMLKGAERQASEKEAATKRSGR
jgi:hypothetical protein